jgi:K+-transporting ATPase ATPase C chain
MVDSEELFGLPARLTRPHSRAGQLQTAVGLLLILAGITGLAYPLLVTAVADLSAPRPAAASLVAPEGRISSLMEGRLADPTYFSGRPQTAFDPHGNGTTALPADIDPDISLVTAYRQVARVAARRGLPLKEVSALLATHARWRTSGEPLIDVLEINRALDDLTARRSAQPSQAQAGERWAAQDR